MPTKTQSRTTKKTKPTSALDTLMDSKRRERNSSSSPPPNASDLDLPIPYGDFLSLVSSRHETSRLMKDLKEEYDRLGKEISRLMGEAGQDRLMADKFKVTLFPGQNTSLDKTRLQERLLELKVPMAKIKDAVETATKVTKYVSVRVTDVTDAHGGNGGNGKGEGE